jgi:hypothetical protein
MRPQTRSEHLRGALTRRIRLRQGRSSSLAMAIHRRIRKAARNVLAHDRRHRQSAGAPWALRLAIDREAAGLDKRLAALAAEVIALGGTRDLVYNVGKNNQLTDRHDRVAVDPFIKQGHRNAQLCSAFFPPESSYHLAEEQLLVRFKQGRGQSLCDRSRKCGTGPGPKGLAVLSLRTRWLTQRPNPGRAKQ